MCERVSYSHLSTSFLCNNNQKLCGIFIFKNQSGTFFKSVAARGQMLPQKMSQDDFSDINTCHMSLPVIFDLLDPFLSSSSGLE